MMCTVKTCEVFKEYMILKEGQQSQLLCLEKYKQIKLYLQLEVERRYQNKVKRDNDVAYNVMLQCVIGKVMVRG